MPHKNMAEAVWDVACNEGRRPYEIRLKDGTVVIGSIAMAQGSTVISVSRANEEDTLVSIDAIATLKRYQPKQVRYPNFA